MRRIPGAMGSSRPYSKAMSRRKGMSTAMAGSPQDGVSAIDAILGPACRGCLPKGAAAMKIKFDIDCTPEELRSFFGLPDVRPMQEELLKEIEERMRAGLKALDPETMLKTWLPAGLKGFEQLQEMFMSQMAGRPGGKK
jgi:hypothetical protein